MDLNGHCGPSTSSATVAMAAEDSAGFEQNFVTVCLLILKCVIDLMWVLPDADHRRAVGHRFDAQFRTSGGP
jgi:hypothetical protein